MNRFYTAHDAKPDDCSVKRVSSSVRIFSFSGRPISWCKITMLPNLYHYFDVKTRINYITCFIRKTSCFCLLLLNMNFFFPLFFPFFSFASKFSFFLRKPQTYTLLQSWSFICGNKKINLCKLLFFYIFHISCYFYKYIFHKFMETAILSFFQLINAYNFFQLINVYFPQL